MKYVVLSFDDGRLDTYTRAIPIMNKYRVTATINVVSDFIEHESVYSIFPSASNKAMTKVMLKEVYLKGFEIACHGHTHKNTQEDIINNVTALKEWGIHTDEMGFASPYSYITKKNMCEIDELLRTGFISYIRSGIQVRRESFFYKAAYIIQELTHNKYLFYLLNKTNCTKKSELEDYVIGVSISSETTFKQIKFLIEKLPDDSTIILILHSILKPTDEGYGADKWYMDEKIFCDLCIYLKSNRAVEVLTNIELMRRRESVYSAKKRN